MNISKLNIYKSFTTFTLTVFNIKTLCKYCKYAKNTPILLYYCKLRSIMAIFIFTCRKTFIALSNRKLTHFNLQYLQYLQVSIPTKATKKKLQ